MRNLLKSLKVELEKNPRKYFPPKRPQKKKFRVIPTFAEK
jgi:hypothetical protein